MIFITGWNEWVAQRQPPNSREAIVFVDCADPNNSRDIEPMNGLFGDNYYMQMVHYIRRYKGAAPRVDVGKNKNIDIQGGFGQWEDVTAVYLDYRGDTAARSATGFGGIRYQNNTGRNDFCVLKAAKNGRSVYFYAQTAETITAPGQDHWMTLFLSSGRTDTEKWYGYDFAVNRTALSGNQAVLERRSGGAWVRVGTVSFRTEGNQMMIEIPRTLLGLPYDGGNGLLDIRFKWADNYQSEDHIWSFYKDGDAAPYGRLNYVFSEKQ